jgi:hypothetical protein
LNVEEVFLHLENMIASSFQGADQFGVSVQDFTARLLEKMAETLTASLKRLDGGSALGLITATALELGKEKGQFTALLVTPLP